ncbi:hypothetical protein PUNSTDRAFT_135934 [Punctularia strigosozonata HHB-11173 SS5]|uniref:uncharacterized protein n=1 Tax=Punctularia strigosozonata (strain HHB-11173) TaxID=741275 RepID=UPI000441766B|nr:uncharacterized protein PUNSTDRAFT_135934 [Punctularia strigosozonata HHB-11173 SS5]EIN07248.1 hypothetical protein PUNSTDRAFT_135934 [Punctularia strigosozonata HHB-11173 SS5]
MRFTVATIAVLPFLVAASEKRAAFTLQNGKDAQALNAKFATLTPSSACTDGENACVQGQFAQCANGKFVTFPCAATLKCVALPLVNSAGTSITCSTDADAAQRIANTGATGGVTGKRSILKEKKRAEFTLQNGKDAQALNAKFASLTADAPCTDGQTECVNGQLSQCVGGQRLLSPCAAGLSCVALPLVNSPGTSITCDTIADAEARISTTGATGGLNGKRSLY